MKDFKDFVELEEGLKPEHKMRPGWMIKADPVLKAKIAANKAKQKEMKAILGKKLKEELVNEDAHKEAETYKAAADAAKKKGDTGSYHAHMANHHDAMAEWNSSKGRESVADSHMKKSEEHHDAFLKHKNIKEDRLPNRHKVQVTASKDGGPKEKIDMKVSATSAAEAKGVARLQLKKKGYDTHSAIHHGIDYDWLKKEEVEQIDELSNDTLASYKKKAGESASEADKKGDFEKGNKRFKGIMKATFKQFANDAKK